ncbi:MAG: TRAP transporter small permease subunit [Burkholderiales bacterium]
MINALYRAFGAIVLGSNCLASIWIFVMMFIIVTDIIMRFVFNAPIDGTTEVIQASIIVVLYLQIAYTLRSGRLTRSDAFYNWLSERHPRIGNALALFFNVAGAALMAGIMWPGWSRWLRAYDAGDFEGIPGVFTFPRWPAFLVLFIGCGLMGIQFLLLVLDNLRGIAGKPPLSPADDKSRRAEELI